MSSFVLDAHGLRISNTSAFDPANRKRVVLEVAYKLFVAEVHGLCFRLLADRRAAEEATVKVFTQFNREAPRRWNETAVSRQLRELSLNEAMQRLGAVPLASTRQAVSVGLTPASVTTVDRATVPAQPQPAPLDGPMLEALVTSLPTDLRVAFVLHDMEGLKAGKIAKYLRVNEDKVRTLIKLARQELRRIWRAQR